MRNFYLIRSDLGHITGTASTLAAALTMVTPWCSVLCVTSFTHVALPRKYRGTREKARARATLARASRV